MQFLKVITGYSRIVVILAILAGIVSGTSKALIVALVNTVINPHPSEANRFLFLAFMTLCLAIPLSRFIAQALLTHLGQKAIFDLRMRLSQQIVDAPLRQLEEKSNPRIMAVLTDDIATISNT